MREKARTDYSRIEFDVYDVDKTINQIDIRYSTYTISTFDTLTGVDTSRIEFDAMLINDTSKIDIRYYTTTSTFDIYFYSRVETFRSSGIYNCSISA